MICNNVNIFKISKNKSIRDKFSGQVELKEIFKRGIKFFLLREKNSSVISYSHFTIQKSFFILFFFAIESREKADFFFILKNIYLKLY